MYVLKGNLYEFTLILREISARGGGLSHESVFGSSGPQKAE